MPCVSDIKKFFNESSMGSGYSMGSGSSRGVPSYWESLVVRLMRMRDGLAPK